MDVTVIGFHLCVCGEVFQRRQFLSVSPQGQVSSGVFFNAGSLVCCHSNCFMVRKGVGGPGKTTETIRVLVRDWGFLASFNFKQIHFVLLKENPMIYTAGLYAT